MARPSKPALSPAEWQAIAGKGDRAASGIVSAMRGAGVASISQREASRRSVSHEWVAQQRKRQKTQPSENNLGVQETMPSDNKTGKDHTGSRIHLPKTTGEVAWVKPSGEGLPANDQEVAKGGKA